jgi:hypothetical protein
MHCPSCNTPIYPLTKQFVCPHCFVQFQVHALKRITIFLLPDNRLAGIYNDSTDRTVSFMGFVQDPPVVKEELPRKQAIAVHKLHQCLNRISTMKQGLNSERESLTNCEKVVERILVSSFGNAKQLVRCRTQLAQALLLVDKLQDAYQELQANLEKAVAQPAADGDQLKQTIQKQVQFVRELESRKNSAFRGLQ